VHLGLTSNSASHRSPWGRWGVETPSLEALLSLFTYDFKFCHGKEGTDEKLSAEQKLSCTDDFLFVIGTKDDFGGICKTESHERVHINLEPDSSTPKSRIRGYVYSSSKSNGDRSDIEKFYRPSHIVGRPHSDLGKKPTEFIAYNYGTLSQGLGHFTIR